MLILAHRGASADAPENTLPAFAEAVAQRADGVELDAMVCGSGEVVVCHDEVLDRLAGLDWHVAQTPLAKLRSADVGRQLGKPSASIPTLSEVLDLLGSELLVNIELKSDGLDDRGLSVKVAELVRSRALWDCVVVSSFDPLCLMRLAAHEPRIRRGFLIDPDRSFAWQDAVLTPLTSSHSVHPHHRQLTPERVANWKKLGLKIATWTVDDPEGARAAFDLGVDYLITNRPKAIRDAL